MGSGGAVGIRLSRPVGFEGGLDFLGSLPPPLCALIVLMMSMLSQASTTTTFNVLTSWVWELNWPDVMGLLGCLYVSPAIIGEEFAHFMLYVAIRSISSRQSIRSSSRSVILLRGSMCSFSK